MHTPFVDIHFTLEATAEKISQFALFALRQHFQTSFRRVTGCLSGVDGCRVGSLCPCSAVFAQQLTPDPAALRRYQKPPLPFAFTIPVLPEKQLRNRGVELSLVTVGEATSQLGYFIKTVRALFASPGIFSAWRVVTVEAVAGDGVRVTIPAGDADAQFSSLPLLSFDELFTHGGDCSRITIDFQTPLRLLHKGAPQREIPFSALIGALFRRISSLAYYYGGEELPHDFKWLAERSRWVNTVRSDLRWVNRGGGLQGIEGELTFAGELAEFMPFLSLGSRLNVGKGASYGMGSYRIELEGS